MIRQAAVFGAGTMGAGIAAQFANAGIPVLLLDIVPGAAERAVTRLLQAEPAAFMHRRAARLVTPGLPEDHLPALAEADWIVEAVVERLEAKQALYARIGRVKRPGAVLSSNTSTIPLARLTEGMAEDLAADFLISHFFNPPRYMRLLELVAGPRTQPQAVALVREVADRRLGKSVVMAKDTPGFIANRIGIYWLQAAVTHAVALGLTVAEADAVLSRPFGIPKTGAFGLLDLVGLDLMPAVLGSMAAALPQSDPLQAVIREVPVIGRLIATGYTGRKGLGGFYRRNGGKQAVDLRTGDWHPVRKPDLDSLDAAMHGGAAALLAHRDRGGQYARAVMGGTLAYAASLLGEIADDAASIDRAMRLGYGWTLGPFEMMDMVRSHDIVIPAKAGIHAASTLDQPVPPMDPRFRGDDEIGSKGGGLYYRICGDRLQCLGADGAYHDAQHPDGVLLLSDVKRRGPPLARTGSASLWDIGDGVACLEVHSKMNTLDPEVMALIRQTVARRPRALVIHSEAENFSVGANIGLALFAANIGLWTEIERLVAEGQETCRALRRAPFPVVAAPSGLALGGGCELLLHCDAVQAHAETYVGLVETGVGIVPAWGGCAALLARWQARADLPNGPMPGVAKVFETVALATVAKSAAEAMALGFLRPDDGITMNRDRLLADAKARALALADGYAPPPPVSHTLPGPAGRAALMLMVDGLRRQGKATAHDAVVAEALAEVLTGGDADITAPVTEDDILALERRAFMRLIRQPATLARLEHMLETGKPLRN